MKSLIDKWRARAAVEARASIAAVYLECAEALEKACFADAMFDAARKASAHAADRDVMVTVTREADCITYTVHNHYPDLGKMVETPDRRPPAQHDIDPAHALPAERL